MADAWTQTALGAICRFQAGDAFGRNDQGRTVGDHPFIKVSDMNLVGNEIYISRANNWVSDEEAQHNYRLHPKNGVVFAKIGIALTYNRRRRLVRPTIIDNNMMSAVPMSDVDPIWFYYLLSTLDFNLISSGSALPFLTVKDLSRIQIDVPTKPEQEAIASVLGSLDDKIELNRRMNETLEATARAIFKDWFVDFGPTRAKMEGRAPYLAAAVWSLFPPRLDGDGKPEGWVFGTLSDVARQTGESVKPEALDPDTPYIGLEHMPRKSIALSDWEGAGKVTSGKLAFRKGDFLFGKLRPYFHKVGIAPIDGICSTDIVVLNARERRAAAFVLTCISQDEFVAFTDRTSDGTKMPRTSWGRMEQYGLCLPSASELEAFNACVEPMLDRIISNIHESHTLAATRDFLLPKLMSGEVRVRDVEKFVGEAI
jgi:type I restriction enzyme S subunit